MNLTEAKQLLKKSGYVLLKENTDFTTDDFNISSDYEGTSDYEPDDALPHPLVFVNPPSIEAHDFIKKYFIDTQSLIEGTEIEGVYDDDDDLIEFVFPETDFCDYEMRQEYENLVKSLIDKALEIENQVNNDVVLGDEEMFDV